MCVCACLYACVYVHAPVYMFVCACACAHMSYISEPCTSSALNLHSGFIKNNSE